MRRPYVAGNWKMNLLRADAEALVKGLAAKIPAGAPVDVAVFPPAVLIPAVAEAAKGSPITFGAQNCYFEASGAFTGEISVDMIKDTGAASVLIGHSERRHVFGETGDMLKKKVVAALAAGLKVIYCVGELLEEREANKTEEVLDTQLTDVLGPDIDLTNVVIAYEPVWAIGTGKTASPQQAQDAHAYIRQQIAKLYNAEAAETLRIQYGGSVKASNAEELLSQTDVDGALVGGASLKVDEFIGIIEGAIAAQG